MILCEFSASLGQLEFEWEEFFEMHPSARVEFQPHISLDSGFLPLMWVFGDDIESVEATLRDLPRIASISRMVEGDKRALFRVSWTIDAGSLRHDLQTLDCFLAEAVGTADGWLIEVFFSDRDELVEFHQVFLDHNISLTIMRLEEGNPTFGTGLLSPEQQQAVRLAHRSGYFEVPRECTLDDLAEEVDISTSAFSERLRRGFRALAEGVEGPTWPSNR